MKDIFTFALLLFSLFAQAQKESWHWYFGDHAGIDFSSENPVLVIAILEACFKKANSKESFTELLIENDLKTYERSGRTNGIIYKGQKFRFKRLGVTEDRFDRLEKVGVHEKNIHSIRKANLQKEGINRTR